MIVDDRQEYLKRSQALRVAAGVMDFANFEVSELKNDPSEFNPDPKSYLYAKLWFDCPHEYAAETCRKAAEVALSVNAYLTMNIHPECARIMVAVSGPLEQAESSIQDCA